MRVTRVAVCVLVMLCWSSASADAQTMRDALNRLFVFSSGSDPLFLGGSAGIPSTQVHGDHFIPSESEANGAVLEFFNAAIASNIAHFPLGSTVSSQTFVFQGGVPTPTSGSFGPIFSERAPTLGRGRFNAGLSYSRLSFSTMRGIPLNDLTLRFVHENSDFPGCDSIFGGDCTEYGTPQFEHDVIELQLDMGIQADVFVLHAAAGVTDWLDVSLAVPVVKVHLRGRSRAELIPSEAEVFHFFGGTPEAPVLHAETSVQDDASGVGDIAARLKARFLRTDVLDMALLGEVRIPTGREEDFLGTGEFGGRGLLIMSGTFGDFSPHLNAGFLHRGGESGGNIELALGFDHRLAPWATLAVDLLSTFQIDEERIAFPEPLEIHEPYHRIIERTNIPNTRDDVIDGAIGVKFRTGSGIVLVANALVALNNGGLRSRVVPTFGLEYGR